MAELRAAVIGVGAFGQHHARIYHELASEGVRLVGLVDIDPDGPRKFADRYSVPLVSHVSCLPEAPDVVSVAVPTSNHREVAEPLLGGGIHCLVEKPVAGSSSAARSLVHAAERGGAHLQVGLVERFNPVLEALDRLEEPPVYSEVHRLAPFVLRAADVGVVMDMMIHDLDIVRYVAGEDPSDVQAVGVSLATDHEDVCNARITFPSGCVANITSSRVAQQRMRRTRIFTRSAYLSLDYDRRDARLVHFPKDVRGWSDQVAALAAQQAHLDQGRVSGATADFEALLQTEHIPIADREPLDQEIRSLVSAVRTGHRPKPDGVEGLRALGLAEQILASIRSASAPGILV